MTKCFVSYDFVLCTIWWLKIFWRSLCKSECVVVVVHWLAFPFFNPHEIERNVKTESFYARTRQEWDRGSCMLHYSIASELSFTETGFWLWLFTPESPIYPRVSLVVRENPGESHTMQFVQHREAKMCYMFCCSADTLLELDRWLFRRRERHKSEESERDRK